jgi:glycosyltransferase involved in cell wall biosynthesis
MSYDVTVLVPTRNRATILKETLEAFCRVRRNGLEVEFLVIDNGATDATADVLREFASRLPMRVLYEARPGKCNALNLALREVELGQIVVFTDDDVTPDAGWLEAIVEACGRWPRHSVFGGRVEIEWPCGVALPSWVRQPQIQQMAFSAHRLGAREGEYPNGLEPFGLNFWVRREALEGASFFEGIGPHPTRRTLGDETLFLRQLRARGFIPLHVPGVAVKHRIEADRVTRAAVYRRSIQFGRGCVHSECMPEQHLRQASSKGWALRILLNVAMGSLSAVAATLEPNEDRRFSKLVSELMTLGRNLEALSCFLQGRRSAAEECGLIALGSLSPRGAE